jgi:hypothetical protein
MDLKTVIERLRRIEDADAPMCDICGKEVHDPHAAAIVELRLDIEAYVLRTTGTL